jgi:hypothetical protein
MTPEEILARFEAAAQRRRPLEGIWQACYDHALPTAGDAPLFDATAADAAEQLAASLLAELTPPWSRWFGLAAARPGGPDAPGAMEAAAEALQAHLDRSNFAMEMHEAFLDLVVAGTGLMLVQEAPPGVPSALSFTAVPLREAVLEEGTDGRLDTVFRALRMTPEAIAARWPQAVLPQLEANVRHRVVEASFPDPRGGHLYAAILADEAAVLPLASGRFAQNPFIAFRWLKVPGETYGRGPVQKALPDIRTANKVVELVLKNASIAATGIWMAEDDGVLNPATVRLVPGAIIPKAPGSSGLTPLAAAGNFDVSQLVLADLRARIRTALLADRIEAANKPNMTATEVVARSDQAARLLGATYGRLQAELLTPLVARCLGILARRGEVPRADLRMTYASPVARAEARRAAGETLMFIQAAAALGPEATALLDGAAAARWLARTLGAPAGLLRDAPLSATSPEE